MVTKNPAEINHELSNILDFTNKDVKRFITEFIDRIEVQRKLEADIKKNKVDTSKGGTGFGKKGKQIKDVSKFLVPNRNICYCQCTLHPLVNNCVSCGKVVCELEGEGPCLFCGSWVDRD